MSDKEECQLKAGHPPAGKLKWFYFNLVYCVLSLPFFFFFYCFSVKAGGMRITQHKSPHDKNTSGGLTEDTTGLKMSSR